MIELIDTWAPIAALVALTSVLAACGIVWGVRRSRMDANSPPRFLTIRRRAVRSSASNELDQAAVKMLEVLAADLAKQKCRLDELEQTSLRIGNAVDSLAQQQADNEPIRRSWAGHE